MNTPPWKACSLRGSAPGNKSEAGADQCEGIEEAAQDDLRLES
ncbi:hypothetical protein P0Y43_11955 [Pseudomonas entomophila]|nr:hypothetical protein [Pseudomonas entomophila]MDF0731437.1 hypothetical protein [Pseudomonas entomophila]